MIRNFLTTYSDGDKFLALFNPDKQSVVVQNPEKAFCGKAPCLGLVARALGAAVRDSWLDIQLTELAAFSGCKDKLTGHQLRGLIEIIADEYGFLKVTELMYFFRRFKSGAYGKFYGAVDPMVITCALRDFLDERRRILADMDAARKEAEQKAEPAHLRFVNECHERKRMNEFYSFNLRSADFTLDEFSEIWWLFKLGYERYDHGYDC